MIILGIDPGLGTTGWGIIVSDGNRLAHIGNGRIRTDAALPLAQRLAILGEALNEIVVANAARNAAMEEVFVNKNAQSTLKLAQARGMLLGCLGFKQILVGEYAPRLVKQAVTGTGVAEKIQVHAMVKRLLPGVRIDGADAADALAVAITHAHHLASARRLKG
ncbi:crossover junction endodeoxyribonuclease RuvC [Sphingomonas sp.]|uniref:crossover junction endodeoxyribonuclease RuvC n=1 Tax=Sphingomonas sp. TaxID=28214 RepID=UPI0025F0D88E|nr:crossover junction endodeoxyribonuclease RuvC [Sphingomonas sp.]